jgi:aryl-alcohol dehydrogenase-like predicted oxidoreductase
VGTNTTSSDPLSGAKPSAGKLEVTSALRHFGIGLLRWSPLGDGLLGGALQKADKGRRSTDTMRQQIERHRPQLEAYEPAR